jgi:hypothetical protein
MKQLEVCKTMTVTELITSFNQSFTKLETALEADIQLDIENYDREVSDAMQSILSSDPQSAEEKKILANFLLNSILRQVDKTPLTNSMLKKVVDTCI